MDIEKHLSELQIDILTKEKENIEKEIGAINESISDLQEQVIKSARKIDKLSIQVRVLQSQLGEIDKKIAEAQARPDDMDLVEDDEKMVKRELKYLEKIDKKEELEDIKQELEDARNAKKSAIAKKYYQRKIDRADKKIEKLNKKANKLEGKQRNAIISKHYLEELKDRKINKKIQERKYYREVSNDMKEIRDDILDEGKFLSGARAKFYDHKANKYKKKQERANNKLKKMMNKGVSLKSARAIVWTKNRVNKARNINFKNGMPILAV